MESFVRLIVPDNSGVVELERLVEQVSKFQPVDANCVQYAITEHDSIVLHIPTKTHLTESDSEQCAILISEMFDGKHTKDLDIEFSTGIPLLDESANLTEPERVEPESYDIFNKTDYDLVNDLVVFMRNDFRFYRSYYYPALHRAAKEYKRTKRLDIRQHLMPTIKTAISEYCVKYDTPEEPGELFGNDEISAIIDRIQQEELPEIRKGEYS